ncbi:MAG: FlgO family outer membrane protein [Colwellia sp.]|nr:FlgO family outer membrane protein [Colwellia sp.]
MKIKFGLYCVIALLTACSSTNNTSKAACGNSSGQTPCQQTQYNNQPTPQKFYSIEQQQQELSQTHKSNNNVDKGFTPQYHHKLLTDYVEQLAMKLTDSIQSPSHLTPIAIASFVSFNESLHQAGPAGNQIAELLYAELQSFGLVMLDYKTSEFINITRSGDFVFDRNEYYDYYGGENLDYVLSGTLITVERGLLVNARIISTRDKHVVAAAKLLIPNFALPRS